MHKKSSGAVPRLHGRCRLPEGPWLSWRARWSTFSKQASKLHSSTTKALRQTKLLTSLDVLSRPATTNIANCSVAPKVHVALNASDRRDNGCIQNYSPLLAMALLFPFDFPFYWELGHNVLCWTLMDLSTELPSSRRMRGTQSCNTSCLLMRHDSTSSQKRTVCCMYRRQGGHHRAPIPY